MCIPMNLTAHSKIPILLNKAEHFQLSEFFTRIRKVPQVLLVWFIVVYRIKKQPETFTAVFVTTALARSHYCNHVRFPNVS